ncbi:sensor histidine kinase [Aggregatilinea lenta]|uniref:sensor histidine kinase n=1 Tax=Aggregatilinea lenta TaxID=913108 RepID=UPI0013C33B74|nr:ATP-binding protein [Aggregatilinea lenta]
MESPSDKVVRQVTTELRQERLWNLHLSKPSIEYRPVPHDVPFGEGTDPIWRISFDLAYDPKRRFGLDVNDEIVLGRGDESPDIVSLDPYDADELGVSRRHAMLRPTESRLYIVDLGSTNGTWLNGRSIGVNTPYSLSNGDLLMLGKLEFIVRIVDRPAAQVQKPEEANVVGTLLRALKVISSQLEMKDVLNQAVQLTMSLTSVSEAAIWLVDEQNGDLCLEVGCGLENGEPDAMRLSVADSLVGQVIQTGTPLNVHREAGDVQVKMKTGYLVEALMCVPITLGGVTFGVLTAAHHQKGQRFSARDKEIVTAIADFTAIGVQNARLFQSTSSALTRYAKIVTALNYALAYDVKPLLNSILGYAGLLNTYSKQDEDILYLADNITSSSNDVHHLLEQLLAVTQLTETHSSNHNPCDLVEIVTQAANDQRPAADDKLQVLQMQLVGTPYSIYGNGAHLYHSVFHLIDNAVKYSPLGAHISVTLGFAANEILIRVCDTGPGIPEDDLPHLFDKVFRRKKSLQAGAGIGLGLEFVRTTVEAHRGTIHARNLEESGAEFVVMLPATLRVS